MMTMGKCDYRYGCFYSGAYNRLVTELVRIYHEYRENKEYEKSDRIRNLLSDLDMEKYLQ